MALIDCPECGRSVSTMATSCPGCGYPIQNKIDKKNTRYSAEEARELLKNRDIDYTVDNFFEAAHNDNIEVIRLFLAAGMDVNAKNKHPGWSMLIDASLSGRLVVVKELLAHGADVNMISDLYGTALMAATVFNQVEVVKELLAHGADVNIKNTEGLSPYGFASLLPTHAEIANIMRSHMR